MSGTVRLIKSEDGLSESKMTSDLLDGRKKKEREGLAKDTSPFPTRVRSLSHRSLSDGRFSLEEKGISGREDDEKWQRAGKGTKRSRRILGERTSPPSSLLEYNCFFNNRAMARGRSHNEVR